MTVALVQRRPTSANPSTGSFHLEFKDKATWRYVTGELEKAADGAETEDIAVALRMVLSFEGRDMR
jgi:hypothetical protein